MASNTNSSGRSKLFNKGLFGRLGAVGMFVALGTFAVIQSINGPSPEDEIASANKSGDSIDDNDSQTLNGKTPSGGSGKTVTGDGKVNNEGIMVGDVSPNKIATQKPLIDDSGQFDVNNNNPANQNDNSNPSALGDGDGSDLLNKLRTGSLSTNQQQVNNQTHIDSSNDGDQFSNKPPSTPPNSLSGSAFNPGSAFSPGDSVSSGSSGLSPASAADSTAPKLLDNGQSNGFDPIAQSNPSNSNDRFANSEQTTPPPSNPMFGGQNSFGGQDSQTQNANPDQLTQGNLTNGNSISSKPSFGQAENQLSQIPNSVAKMEISQFGNSGSFDTDQGNSSPGNSNINNQAPNSSFGNQNPPTLASSSTNNSSGSLHQIDSSMPATGNVEQEGDLRTNNGGFVPNQFNQFNNQEASTGNSTQQNSNTNAGNSRDTIPGSSFPGDTSGTVGNSTDQTSGFNPQNNSGNSLTARPVPPHQSLDANQDDTSQVNQQSNNSRGNEIEYQSPNSFKMNPNESAAANSRLPSSTQRQDEGNRIPAHEVSHSVSTTPGDRRFEGLQTPSLTLEKVAPGEIQVGRPAKFELIVKNVGNVAARHVVIHDSIPEGTRLQNSAPQAEQTATGQLSWKIGTLEPGARKVVELILVPTQRGEIGSVATVSFAATAAVRTRSTKPELIISHHGPARVLIGDPVALEIKVENRGDGAAENVTIQEEVPEGLQFQNGIRDLEYTVGTLGPGQSKTIKLNLLAKKIGKYKNTMVAFGEGPLKSQDTIDIEVIAPQLQLSGAGPKRRFLNRPATHQFTIQNNGTAAASNVEMVARLPRGLTFVSADQQGRYDSRSHSVFWALPALQVNTEQSVKIETRPTATGEQTINFEIAADRNQSQKTEQTMNVEQLAELFFDIDDTADPIELGSETSYQVRVVNQGSKVATNIRVLVEFPQAITPSSIVGGSGNEIQGQVVTLPTIPKLSPGEEKSIAIKAKGMRVGDHRVIIKVQSDDRTVAESKEESTKVYSDR